MKRDRILAPLESIRRRCRIQRMIEGVHGGLFFGSLAVLPVLLARLGGLLPDTAPGPLLAIPLSGGILLGGVFGRLRPLGADVPAKAADRYYRLKDRLLTAVALLSRSRPSPMEHLQLEDAALYAEKIDPKDVVPYRFPKHLGQSLLVVSVVAVLGLTPPLVDRRRDAAADERLTEVVSAVDLLREELLEKIEELAGRHPEETALRELSNRLQTLLARLDETAADRKESLATLSEMEQAIRTVLDGFRLETVDASMKELADALIAADATRAAGRAMKDEHYAQAAEEFGKLTPDPAESMSQQERRAVSEQIRQALRNARRLDRDSLSKAAEKFADSIERGDAARYEEGAGDMAAECRKQSIRKEIGERLEVRLAMLGLGKSECSGGTPDSPESRGGDAAGGSVRESRNWGTDAAGNPTSGEETRLDGRRERQNVGGILGTGDSEYETIRSPAALSAEKSNRELQERFREYRKMSEAVLESEPIPLGQRRMIRRYFEAIRPVETGEKD